MDDKIAKLEFGEDFLYESAEKRFDAGDYLGALRMLNKRAEMHEPSADACALYADIYEELGIYPLCADAWFRFLDTCNEADFAEGYEGLSVAFMNMGDVFQSELYLRRTYEDEETPEDLFDAPKPQLRLVHSDDGSVENAELLRRGIEFIKTGELDRAREALSEVPPASEEFPSASGLSAMCLLLQGDTDGAAAECRKLLEYHPDNIHALTTYCAVLGAQGDREGAREIGKRLAAAEAESTEDLFRVATALCETGLDGEAYAKLAVLKDRIPYGDDILWFHAVAAYRTGRREEAIDSLERLTTVYPRKAVARYYLGRMREWEEGDPPLQINYFYRMPDDEYKTVASFLLTANAAKQADAAHLADLPDIGEYFRIAFDHLDGRDEKMQTLAVKVAAKIRCDGFLRDILLDFNVDESVKLVALRDLIMRNEENSFGVVICGIYREFFTHSVEIGALRNAPFMKAFADVYSKYALIAEENEDKIASAAEEVYSALEEAGALDYAEEEAEIAAVIYREARIAHSEHSVEGVAKLFDANIKVVKEILNFII